MKQKLKVTHTSKQFEIPYCSGEIRPAQLVGEDSAGNLYAILEDSTGLFAWNGREDSSAVPCELVAAY